MHLTTYAAWASAVVHGLFIGTDSAEGWMVAIYVGCVAAVGLAVLARIVAVLNSKRLKPQVPHGPRTAPAVRPAVRGRARGPSPATGPPPGAGSTGGAS